MKRLTALALTAAFTLILTVAFSFPASTQDLQRIDPTCSCVASDGSCSASVTCTNGCQKYCGNNGNCYAYCSGVFPDLYREVTLEIENGTYPQLVEELSRVSGVNLEFVPLNPNSVFNAGYKKAVLWGALESLSEYGTVRVAGQDFQRIKRLRRILVSNEKISFAVRDTSVKTFVADLAALTGLPLRVTAGNPKSMVNVELPEATLDDIIAVVSEKTGTIISEDIAGRGGR